ncbi:MAG: hypothetical protein EXX96DRAFT_614239 [Benjaminiella poitrasii]|nr:MAG: hypothetical protein EXX96DRAFT_614239 [Benjaminiella poitrasii]
MKFSSITSTIFGATVLFASKVLANVEHFNYPSHHAVFAKGSIVHFEVDDMCDGDDDDIVRANLYRVDGQFVETIQTWSIDDFDDDDSSFTWRIGPHLPEGTYFVEVRKYEDDDDDCEDDEDDDDDCEDDDVARSFVFDVVCPDNDIYKHHIHKHHSHEYPVHEHHSHEHHVHDHTIHEHPVHEHTVEKRHTHKHVDGKSDTKRKGPIIFNHKQILDSSLFAHYNNHNSG